MAVHNAPSAGRDFSTRARFVRVQLRVHAYLCYRYSLFGTRKLNRVDTTATNFFGVTRPRADVVSAFHVIRTKRF